MRRFVRIIGVVAGFVLAGNQALAVWFPTPYVTRSEAAMILIKTRLHTNIPPVVPDRFFPDVESGEWYERYVVLAERYGILEAHPKMHTIRPHDVVLRAEFLKMVTSAYGLPQNLPHFYRDVPLTAWYAPYAGLAQQYNIFPGDADKGMLHAGSVMTHDEVIKALITLGTVVDPDNIPSLADQERIARARRDALSLAESTSTQRGEVALVQQPAPYIPPKPSTPPAYEDPGKIPFLRAEIIKRVNLERVVAGLPPLRVNSALQRSAQNYADDMSTHDFFGHISPAGQTLRERIEQTGFYASLNGAPCNCLERFIVGENLGRGQKTAKEVMDAWMRSASHRQAILTAEFTDIGIGISSGIWVQHFGGKKNSN